MAEQANQPIGKVTTVLGTVKAVAADGSERILQPDNPIFLNDRINTGDQGAISIIFNDPASTQLDLGRLTEIEIDQSLLAAEEVDLDEVTAEIEAIQQALESGDEIEFAETAAGPTAGSAGDGGGGRPIYRDSIDGRIGEVTSGAETAGVGFDFTGVLLDPAAEPVSPVPVQAVLTSPPAPEPRVAEPEPIIPEPPEDIPPPPPPPPPTNGGPAIGSDQVVIDETFFDLFGDNDTETSPPAEFPTSLTSSFAVDFGFVQANTTWRRVACRRLRRHGEAGWEGLPTWTRAWHIGHCHLIRLASMSEDKR